LLITTILLTGCTATYEIDITKDKINDVILLETNSEKVNSANKTTTDLFTQKIG
jgi:hypothetical protein